MLCGSLTAIQSCSLTAIEGNVSAAMEFAISRRERTARGLARLITPTETNQRGRIVYSRLPVAGIRRGREQRFPLSDESFVADSVSCCCLAGARARIGSQPNETKLICTFRTTQCCC